MIKFIFYKNNKAFIPFIVFLFFSLIHSVEAGDVNDKKSNLPKDFDLYLNKPVPYDLNGDFTFEFMSIELKELIKILKLFSRSEITIDKRINLNEEILINITASSNKILKEIGNEHGFRVITKDGVTSLKPHKNNSKRTGLVTDKNNIIYSGDKTNKRLKIRNGKILYSDGAYYSGEIKNGLPHGVGQLYKSEDELWIEGHWSNGKLNGFGSIDSIEKNYSGYKYTGEFKDNKIHGYGTKHHIWGIHRKNKKLHFTIFEGTFINNKPNGYGYLTLSEKSLSSITSRKELENFFSFSKEFEEFFVFYSENDIKRIFK